MTNFVTFRGVLPKGACHVLVPAGLSTPEARCRVHAFEGGQAQTVIEASTGQQALWMTPEGDTLSVTYAMSDEPGALPEAIFEPRSNKFSRFADELADEVEQTIQGETELARATSIACATAERFTYGHPVEQFNDGFDAVPALGCGLTEGSCVDINTYFIAALRSAGFEAGYITGFFFPEEKGGTCSDGHCWVVTRLDGAVQYWDIAHHLKMGTRDIRPGLNPKPGRRVACFHSMGLDFLELGIREMKALIEPVAVSEDQKPLFFEAPDIRWHDEADLTTERPTS